MAAFATEPPWASLVCVGGGGSGEEGGAELGVPLLGGGGDACIFRSCLKIEGGRLRGAGGAALPLAKQPGDRRGSRDGWGAVSAAGPSAPAWPATRAVRSLGWVHTCARLLPGARMMGAVVPRSRVLQGERKAGELRLPAAPARPSGPRDDGSCGSAPRGPPPGRPSPPSRGRRGGAGLGWPAEGRGGAPAAAAAARMTTEELAGKLSRRLRVEGGAEPEEEEEEEGGEAEGSPGPRAPPAGQLSPGGAHRVFSPYSEFREFSRRQIKDMERLFRQYDAGKDGFIDLMELKRMMEKLGAPQTHLGLKSMIKEVDEDVDSKLSFREFLLIFRKAAAGELEEDSGLHALACLSEIDVSTEGVKGAKSFFEAKVQAMNVTSRFEEEIKAEKEEKRRQAEELKQRKEAFKELQSTFGQ